MPSSTARPVRPPSWRSSTRPVPGARAGRGPRAGRRRRRQPDRLEVPRRRDRPDCRSTRSCRARTAPASSTPSARCRPSSRSATGSGSVLAQHGRPDGTAAEFTVQPADRVVRAARRASFDVGRQPRRPGDDRPPRADRRTRTDPPGSRPARSAGRIVLVAGGAGAVGHAAIQLARWAGATVVTTVSSDGEGGARPAAGAHHVVDYRDRTPRPRSADRARRRRPGRRGRPGPERRPRRAVVRRPRGTSRSTPTTAATS